MTNTLKLISKMPVAIGFASAVALSMATPSFAQEADDNGSSTPNSAYENSYRQHDPASFFYKGKSDEARHAYGSAEPAVRAQAPANEPANIRLEDEMDRESQ